MRISDFRLREEGATIKLTMPGAADIEATVHHLAYLTMDPELPDWYIGALDAEILVPEGQPDGLYSLVVTNPNGEKATLPDVLQVEGFCPRGRVGDLYVANKTGRNDEAGVMLDNGGIVCGDCDPVCAQCNINRTGNILQFDGQTGEFVCVFARSDTIMGPADLVWGPNGNLFVLSIDHMGGALNGLGKVVEFDGQTGECLGILTYSAAGNSSGFPVGLDFGGPDGNLFLLHLDGWVREHDRASGAFLRKVIDASLGFQYSDDGTLLRFGPNGNVLLGGSGCSGDWVLFEADPVSGDIIRVILNAYEVGGCATVDGLLYEAQTDTLLVPSTSCDVFRVDFATGTVLETVIDQLGIGDPGLMEISRDVAFGPAGSLFICSTESGSPWFSDYIPGYPETGAIHEFDGATFEQVQFFGYAHYGEREWSRKSRSHELYRPWRMAFKPLPGDWGGRMAGEDWQVDAWDYDRFVEAYNGGTVNRAMDLLAFDFDHDDDIDCDDWAEFQMAWTAGGSLPPFAPCVGYDPDPDGDGVHTDDDLCPHTPAGIPVDETGRPLADLDGDCDVDLDDFVIFQMSMTGPEVP